jgi:hypothetical protein
MEKALQRKADSGAAKTSIPAGPPRPPPRSAVKSSKTVVKKRMEMMEISDGETTDGDTGYDEEFDP